MQSKTSFFITLFFIFLLQTTLASRALAAADAGPDQTVREGDTVVLDGSNSSPRPFIAAYFWQQTGGSPTVVLEDANTAKASFTAPNVGPDGEALIFQLTVIYFFNRSIFYDTDSTIVNVTFVNDPPTADAGPYQDVDEETTVTLDGSNSSDPDDGIKSYLWKQVSGPSVSLSNPEAVQPTFEAPNVVGSISLTFELTVTDFGGLKDTDTTVVNVTGGNDPPTADAGPDQDVDEETTVTLDGSNSFDPDDGIKSYLWKQILGPSVSLSDPEAVQPTFLAPNVEPDGVSFTFELTVADVGGLQASDTTIVNVIWLNDPPTANAGADQTVLEKSTVTLDGSNSFDPDDGIASYRWKQVAGQSVTFSDPTEDQPTFEAPSFDDSGDQPLIFELIVTDHGGLQSSDSTNVTVSNYEKDNPGASGGGCFIDTAAYGFLNVFVMR
ncbi:MAG: hypothetical protein GWN93_12590 [Deltaproteobacteria bacterium]|nr:hypothetical protein [Deltaproteobacteria bacterium]